MSGRHVVKVMLMVMDEQRVILDRLYKVIQDNCSECEIHRLSKEQQLQLGRYLDAADYRRFDRIVIFSRLKRLIPQYSVLRCIPNLIFLEHDAYQNYMSDSKYCGWYSSFYRRLPGLRVLVSGALVAQKLHKEGLDVRFISKGYDEEMLHNTGGVRDIPIGFLGSLKSTEYSQRKAMLETLAERTGMLVTRTSSGKEYQETLNRIGIFVSADIGMGEYMIKNFEAMACGCVLLAWSQGEEDRLLGFEDMRNVVFYRSADEAVEKIRLLQADPELAARIAHAGQTFVEERYTFARVGRDLAHAIQAQMEPWEVPGLAVRTWARLRFGFSLPRSVENAT